MKSEASQLSGRLMMMLYLTPKRKKKQKKIEMASFIELMIADKDDGDDFERLA